jgi:hypothetical protein
MGLRGPVCYYLVFGHLDHPFRIDGRLGLLAAEPGLGDGQLLAVLPLEALRSRQQADPCELAVGELVDLGPILKSVKNIFAQKWRFLTPRSYLMQKLDHDIVLKKDAQTVFSPIHLFV